MDEESGSDGVEAAGLDEDGVAFFREDGVDLMGDGAGGDGLLEGGLGGAVFQSDVEF